MAQADCVQVVDDGAAAKAEQFYRTFIDAPFYKTSLNNAELIKVGEDGDIRLTVILRWHTILTLG